jgi:hypothetical protein
MTNELRRIQEELAIKNASMGRGQPPPRPTDSDGYEAPSAPPKSIERHMESSVGPLDPIEEKETRRWHKAVAVVDLEKQKLYGYIGTFDLTEEDIKAFTLLATEAMRRAIDAICDAPERSVTKVTTPARGRPKGSRNSAKSTKKQRGTKRAAPTNVSGVAPKKASPTT